MNRMFLLGAVGYPVMELLYRRRTHYSMAIAGGASALLIDRVSQKRGTLLHKSLLCGLGITGIEYLCGQIWNRDYRVWDYQNTPLNIQGQICLPYSLLWCLISAGVLTILENIKPDR